MSEGAGMKATPPQESLGPASTLPPSHPSRARRGRGKRKRWPRCSSGELSRRLCKSCSQNPAGRRREPAAAHLSFFHRSSGRNLSSSTPLLSPPPMTDQAVLLQVPSSFGLQQVTEAAWLWPPFLLRDGPVILVKHLLSRRPAATAAAAAAAPPPPPPGLANLVQCLRAGHSVVAAAMLLLLQMLRCSTTSAFAPAPSALSSSSLAQESW